jgi:cell division protein FtsZ
MGGGTGSGAAAIVAEIAHQIGAMTVAVVTMPFTFEGKRRHDSAQVGLERLRKAVDTLLVVPNDRLLKLVDPKITLDLAFRIADDVLRQGVQGVAELVTQSGLINLSFANLRAILGLHGGAFFSVGYGRGPDRVSQAARTALSHPLLDIDTLDTASGVLIHITVGPSATLTEVTQIVSEITRVAGPEAEIAFGATIDPQMEQDAIQVILVMTGVGNPPPPEPEPVLQPKAVPQQLALALHPQTAEEALAETYALPSLPDLIDVETTRPVRDALDIPAFLRRRS